LGELRLVNTELDAGTKLDATEVASAELIGSMDLGSAELAYNMGLFGDSTRGAQRRHGACRRRTEGGWGMAVTRVGRWLREFEMGSASL
jgi:hypothetical protein